MQLDIETLTGGEVGVGWAKLGEQYFTTHAAAAFPWHMKLLSKELHRKYAVFRVLKLKGCFKSCKALEIAL